MRPTLRILLLVFALAYANASPRPNIILILTDDQDREAFGAYGGKVWTPHLDRMAAEGALFTQAFVTSTVCTPSRYSFLTGRYASRSTSDSFKRENPAGHQAYTAFNMGLEENNLNIGALLSQAGYRTGFVGKFHVSGVEGLRTPADYAQFGLRYIDRNASDTLAVTEAFAHNELQYRKMLTDRGFDWAKNIYLGNLEDPYANHNLEWTIDAALEFIDDSVAPSAEAKPFYLHFCTTLTHGPDASWSRSLDAELDSGAGRLTAPIEPDGMLPRDALRRELKNQQLDPTKGHAGHSWVDAGVGAILAKLTQLGIAENTLVIFTTDHGSRQKGSLFDADGAQVPMLMRWPQKIPAGIKSSELVQSIDIVATAFELAGVKLPANYQLDGRSLVPLFATGTTPNWRDFLYLELGFGRAIRTKDFKYVVTRYPREQVQKIKAARPAELPTLMAPLNRSGIGTRGAANPAFYYEDALFQLETDRDETHNLFGDKDFALETQNLREKLTTVINSIGRPYGEFLAGENTLPPGQVDAQLELVRQMKIRGKSVILPDGTSVDPRQRN
jgi:arylsulfatase A-like enzyme